MVLKDQPSTELDLFWKSPVNIKKKKERQEKGVRIILYKNI